VAAVAFEEARLPFGPPAYRLSDQDLTFWPPEAWHATADPLAEGPFAAEAWERYAFPEDRLKVLERQEAVTCTTPLRVWRVGPVREFVSGPDGSDDTEDAMAVRFRGGDVQRVGSTPCGAYLRSWRAAPIHQAELHRGQACTFSYVNRRWTYELLGFPELWDGRPRGRRTVLDPRDPRDLAWEADALELGSRAADGLWTGGDLP
jgi:hypothetical protein